MKTAEGAPSWLVGFLFVERLARFSHHSVTLEAFACSGDCMRPYFMPGDRVVVDRALGPRSGECVLIEMRYRANSLVLGAGVRWRIELGLKQFIVDDAGEHWLVCADGRVRADGHEIIGPVVAAYRRGWFRQSLKRVQFTPEALSSPRAAQAPTPEAP